jgi:hypothetical protein
MLGPVEGVEPPTSSLRKRCTATCASPAKAPGQGFEPRSWTSKAHVLPLDDTGMPVIVSVGGLEPPASTFAEWCSVPTELNARSSGRGIRTPIIAGNSRTLYLLSYPTMRWVGWDLNPLSVNATVLQAAPANRIRLRPTTTTGGQPGTRTPNFLFVGEVLYPIELAVREGRA